jgi:hypothetical protein
MQALQLHLRPDALALGFEAKAAVGLVIAADSNVTVCGSHCVPSFGKHHEGQDWPGKPRTDLGRSALNSEGARTNPRPLFGGPAMINALAPPVANVWPPAVPEL